MSSFTGPAAGENGYPEECVICQDALVALKVSVLFTRNNQRSCSHYFHTECINTWHSRHNSCPICKRQFDHVQAMTSPLENPEEWYRIANADANPELNKQEVINALKATIPLDYR